MGLIGLNHIAALLSGFKLVRPSVAGVLLLAMLAGLSGKTQTAWSQTMLPQATFMTQTAQAQPVQRPIPTLQPPVAGYVFPARQTLTFTVDWRVFTGGTAVFHLEQQGDQMHVMATADTVGAVNMLFPVVDRFQSGFNVRTGCSPSMAVNPRRPPDIAARNPRS